MTLLQLHLLLKEKYFFQMATPTWTNPSSRYKTFLHILYEQKYLSVLYIKQILHVTMYANVFHVTLYFDNSHKFTIAKNNEFSLLHAVTNFARQKPNLFDQTIRQNCFVKYCTESREAKLYDKKNMYP
jgi:hypothetical protein